MKRVFATWAVAIALVGFLVAGPAGAADVNLSVAASLTDVVKELSGNFTKTHPGVVFRSNFGASGALAKQIENGAPADLFISANVEWMDYLKARNLMDEKTITTFAYNVLVFVGKPGMKVNALPDVTKLGRIAIGSPKSVPAGQYAMEAFRNAGIEKDLQGKLVMAKDVRECLLYADRGEVDGAFVYKTDAMQAKRARILFTVPEDLYPRVTYPMGLTLMGARNKDAGAFYGYLQSGHAKAVLDKFGFAPK